MHTLFFTIVKLLGCFSLAVAGAFFLYSPIAPHYRTVEVSPGLFDEQWLLTGDNWIFTLIGIALLVCSAACLLCVVKEMRSAVFPIQTP